MKRSTKTLAALVSLVIVAAIGYVGWSMLAAPPAASPEAVTSVAPEPAAAPVVPDAAPAAAAAASAPAIQYPIEAIAVTPPAAKEALPALQEADAYIRQALSDFLDTKDMLRFLQPEQLVAHLVATVDNLPRPHAAVALWPVTPTPGRFSVGSGDDSAAALSGTIHPDNHLRYSPFVAFVEAIDKTKAVALYVHLYPLFQQAYRDLGYPKGSFNDRLVEVIDHLLALPVQIEPLHVSRPDVKGEHQPRAPWVTYQFTDPALNDLSAGQKILLRTGAVHHQRLRTQLMAIRAQLTGAKQ